MNVPIEEEQQFPEPLEFFTQDYIHPDNQAVIEHEQQRWRLLSRWERWRLRRYVAALARDLQEAGYNPLFLEHDRLRREFRAAKAAYRAATFINDETKRAAQQHILAIVERGKQNKQQIEELKPVYEQYKHYAEWLDYEQENRRDLKAEARREKRIRADMRKEAQWLELLIKDVFRKTSGCHYIYKHEGKEITRIPRFERSVIKPDAHWFYLQASKHVMWWWRWMLPNGVTIDRLTDDDVIANLRAATKRQVDAIWTETHQLAYRVSRLDSPDALPRNVKWRDAMQFFPQDDANMFPYVIGIKDDRKFAWFDFVTDPHVLVAGKSQSGKSNLVNGIIATLVSTHSPKELRLVLIDMKGGVEFTHWEEVPHLLWEMVKNVDEVQPVLQRLVAIIRRRMETFAAVKAKKLEEYNARVAPEHQLERVLVCIDEMNTFVGLGSLTEDIHNLIMIIVSQGRAAGVHMIAATQHPEVKVIPGRIKTNMSIRMSGAMPSISSSMVILDSPEAAKIPNIPGRFVSAVGLETLRVQVPQIFDQDIEGVVSSARQQYPDVANELSDMAEQPALTIWNEQRVLKASIEWLEGHLSGQALHKMLGSEDSPGERHLAKMCRRLIDEAAQFNFVTLLENGSQWSIKKRGRAYHLEARPDQSGDQQLLENPVILSDQASD